MTSRSELVATTRGLIERAARGHDIANERDAHLVRLAAWQVAHVPAYRAYVAARRRPPDTWRHVEEVPALPTDAFRATRVAAHPPASDVRCFRSSGTTMGDRSLHAFQDLSLYDLAAQTAARAALFPDRPALRLVVLAPSERERPDSSLSYMLGRFAEWFGRGTPCYVWRDDRLDLAALVGALEEAVAHGVPVALCGTSFAFVHAEDGLGDRRFTLPPASRIMQTGGYKARSREVDPPALRAALSRRYGVPDAWLVTEYGMTELTSQLYDGTLRAAVGASPGGPRALAPPAWVRASVVDPERMRCVPRGEVGLLRIDDAANVDSACAVLTSDLARESDGGLLLVGRAPGAALRGCSLAADDALSGAP